MLPCRASTKIIFTSNLYACLPYDRMRASPNGREVMRKLSTEKRAAIVSALVEGNSVNATVRMCGVSKITVLRLLGDFGTFCAQYHNVFVRNLNSKRVQLDEIWSFCGCKDKARDKGAAGYGSVWTWTGIHAEI